MVGAKEEAFQELQGSCGRLTFFKSLLITEFLDDYGEDGGWDEWVSFLHEYPEIRGFEWVSQIADNSHKES